MPKRGRKMLSCQGVNLVFPFAACRCSTVRLPQLGRAHRQELARGFRVRWVRVINLHIYPRTYTHIYRYMPSCTPKLKLAPQGTLCHELCFSYCLSFSLCNSYFMTAWKLDFLLLILLFSLWLLGRRGTGEKMLSQKRDRVGQSHPA